MRICVGCMAVLAGCGGGSAATKPAQTPPPPAAQIHAEPAAAPAAPAAPVIHHAKAAMTPTKASKLEPFTVGFMQREGDNALVLADLPVGVKPGRYHYVIHDGGECGADGAKAGPAWRETKDQDLVLVVLADLTGALDNSELAAHLHGEQTLIGHTLALHDDKKGKPGKLLACGTIEESSE